MTVIIHGSSTAAVLSNNVGVGYGGSGFLIFYFVGKYLQQPAGDVNVTRRTARLGR
jgi:hypothetical protein